jgi:ubiquinone/menaquinone biosynthesis C-methylase UbiE
MAENTNGFFKPEEILSQLDIRNNMIVADFGCGGGFFSIPVAKLVKRGQVYALDVIKENLEAVRSKAELEGIGNITTVHCNLEILGSSKIKDDSADLVILRNILFQSQKKEEVLKEVKRILKDNGRMVIIEWLKGASLAPEEGWFVSKDELRNLVSGQGLVLDRELSLDNQHYGMVFKK